MFGRKQLRIEELEAEVSQLHDEIGILSGQRMNLRAQNDKQREIIVGYQKDLGDLGAKLLDLRKQAANHTGLLKRVSDALASTSTALVDERNRNADLQLQRNELDQELAAAGEGFIQLLKAISHDTSLNVSNLTKVDQHLFELQSIIADTRLNKKVRAEVDDIVTGVLGMLRQIIDANLSISQATQPDRVLEQLKAQDEAAAKQEQDETVFVELPESEPDPQPKVAYFTQPTPDAKHTNQQGYFGPR